MKAVYHEAANLGAKGGKFVMATVVNTHGSTPQKPGATLLVREDGSTVGTLGGGCVEGDIWFAAKEALKRDTGPIYKDYYLNEEIAAKDGLVCGGSMFFFIEPVTKNDSARELAHEIDDAYQGGPASGWTLAATWWCTKTAPPPAPLATLRWTWRPRPKRRTSSPWARPTTSAIVKATRCSSRASRRRRRWCCWAAAT
jgi:xanthine/CO dehydrogenase XdhC/CoxF family maturation factor